MKMLMISDPSSVHTSNWCDGIKSRDLDIQVIFPRSWISNDGEVLESIRNDTVLLDTPRLAHLVGDSIRDLAFGDLTRDLKNRTKIHQSLRNLGKRIHEFAVSGSFDFIHAHGLATSALLANASGFRPYSASAWGSDIYLMPDKYTHLRSLIAKSISEAAFIHAESQISAKRLQSLSPNSNTRIFISTWGVDTDEYRPNIDSPKIREKLGLEAKKYILSFRSLEPIYRIDLIIKAFAIVANQNLELKLVVAGAGSLSSELRQLVKELSLDDRVTFTGFVDAELKTELFSGALLYLQCPESDGVALSMMEAMSSGLPLISSNVGETSVLIKPGTNGLLVDEATPQNLANAMTDIICDEDLQARMARNSRKMAVEKHSRSDFFKSFIKEVRTALQTTRD
jgi:glycosyltransferase involved in cell wall biosynthesis